MSRSIYSQSTLSGLVDSDSEDAAFKAFNAVSTPDSATENSGPFRKPRGSRVAQSGKVMKQKAAGRRTGGARGAAAKKGSRAALIDKTNRQQAASDAEEVDGFEQDAVMEAAPSGDELDVAVVAVKGRKPRTTQSKAKSKVDKTVKNIPSQGRFTVQPDLEENGEESAGVATATKQIQTKSKGSVEPRQSNEVVQETQVSHYVIEDFGEEEVEQPTPRPAVRYNSVSRTNPQPRQVSVPRRRAGSASDTERGDPAMRRKLGELTKKLENMDMKYRNIREIGIKEAEHNFERLRKENEESKKAANDLIASLKADLAVQSDQSKDIQDLKQTIDTQAAGILKLEKKATQLTSSLAEAHLEIKTLSAKLVATRNAATSVESVNGKGSGSAIKATGGIRMIGSVEAAQAAQVAQLKEDLYSDITGLIIRDVKREAEDDVYDCIQTGRNGTLHFKLAVANEKSAESYDDAHCIYIPQLNPSRDRPLMEILPDYLVEEITFSRPHSAKFYSRVVKALTEKAQWQSVSTSSELGEQRGPGE